MTCRAERSFFSCIWLAAALLAACNSSHTQTSTETGNPPVIDLTKISLVVSSDGVRIVGEPGAVKPGGAEIELTVVSSGEVSKGESKPDGSFDIALDASADAVIELRASDGDERSSSVYVTRGGASVGSGQNGTLSCMQRSQLASQAVGSALTQADTSCQTASDCELVSTKTVCTDSCGDALVSHDGVNDVKNAVGSVDDGLCSSFAADGCQVIALPCTPPLEGPVACIGGKCTQRISTNVACSSCFNRSIEWGPSSALSVYSIANCADFTTTREGTTVCSGKVPQCASGAQESIEDLLQALAHDDVRRAMNQMGTFGGPPAPGGMSTLINIDGRPFLVSNCSGSNCEPIPAGIKALTDLLAGIVDHTECNGM
jgi:hypothetical protein